MLKSFSRANKELPTNVYTKESKLILFSFSLCFFIPRIPDHQCISFLLKIIIIIIADVGKLKSNIFYDVMFYIHIFHSPLYSFKYVFTSRPKRIPFARKRHRNKMFLYAFFCMLLYFSLTEQNITIYYIFIFIYFSTFIFLCIHAPKTFLFYVVVVFTCKCWIQRVHKKKQHERTLLKEHCV